MTTLFKGRDAKKQPITKFLDTKKDAKDRLRYLKTILETHDHRETQQYFDVYYSHIYYVFAEMFTSVEADLKQRVSGAHRDALDSILGVFEKILYHCPNTLHHGWQAQSILVMLKKLLHSGNSIKLRRDGLRLFMAWYQILQENATRECHALFSRLLTASTDDLNSHSQPGGQLDLATSTSSASGALVRPVEVAAIVPPQPTDPAVEKEPGGTARYLLDAMLAFLASENCRICWPSQQMQADAFRFVLERFHAHYLLTLFPDLATRYSLYRSVPTTANISSKRNSIGNGLDEQQQDEDDINEEEAEELQLDRVVRCAPSATAEESALIPCACLGRPLIAPFADELCAQQEVVIRWFATLLHVQQTPAASSAGAGATQTVTSAIGSQHQSRAVSKEDMLAAPAGNTDTLQHFGVSTAPLSGSTHNSNANTLDATDGGMNAGMIKQQLYCEEIVAQAQSTSPEALELMRLVLLRDRDAIDTLLHVLRQVFLLPVKYSAAIRKVIAVYREWCHLATTTSEARPIFMRELNSAGGGERIASPQAARLLKPAAASVNSISNANDVRQAGLQRTVQYIVSSTSRLLLRARCSLVVVDNADLCRRVLSLYRFMGYQLRLDRDTFERFLLTLVHCVKHVVIGEWSALAEPGIGVALDASSSGTRIASSALHVLLATWMRAAVFVPMHTALWDALHDALVSLRYCRDVVAEWGRMLDILTRVLARCTYGVDMNDLPLERLTERTKIKNQVKRNPTNSHAVSSSTSTSTAPALAPATAAANAPATATAGPTGLDVNAAPIGLLPSHLPRAPSPHRGFDEKSTSATVKDSEHHRFGFRKHDRDRDKDRDRDRERERDRSQTETPGRSISVAASGGIQLQQAALLAVIRPRVPLRYSVSSSQEHDEVAIARATRDRLSADAELSELIVAHQQFPGQFDLAETENDTDIANGNLRSRKKGTLERPNSITTDNKIDVAAAALGEPHSAASRLSPSRSPTGPSKTSLVQEVDSRALVSMREESRQSLQQTDTASFVSAETGEADAPYGDGATVNLSVELHVTAGLRAADDSSLLFSPTSQSDDKSQSQSPQYDYARLLNDGAAPPLDSDDEEDVRHRAAAAAADSGDEDDDVMMTDDADSALFDAAGAPRPRYSSVIDDDLNAVDSWPPRNGTLELDPDTSGEAAATPGVVAKSHADSNSPARIEPEAEPESEAPRGASPAASGREPTPTGPSQPACDASVSKDTETVQDSAGAAPDVAAGAASSTGDADVSTLRRAASVARSSATAFVCGGTQNGWTAEAAVVIWRRILGVLGNLNTIESAELHSCAFERLTMTLDTLVRIRANQGVSLDNLSTPPTPPFVSPLVFLAPTVLEAIEKLDWAVFQRSVLLAFRMLVRMTLAGELDCSFDDEYLAQFYRAMHRGLTCYNEATTIRYEIINNCDNRFGTFISRLRGATLLLHDFVYAASDILARTTDVQAPRARAAAILSNVMSVVDLLDANAAACGQSSPASASTWTVFVPTDRSVQYRSVTCEALKEAALAPLLTTAHSKSGDAQTRSIALRALGVFLCGELVRAAVGAQQQPAHYSVHLRFGEALKVLLDSLRSTHLAVASTSVSVLGALADHIPVLLQLHASSDVRNVIESLANAAAIRFQHGPSGRTPASSNDWRNHLVALLFALFEWCMRVPLAVLVEPFADGPIKSLLYYVFNVLHCIVRPVSLPPSSPASRRAEPQAAPESDASSLSPDSVDHSDERRSSGALLGADWSEQLERHGGSVRSPPNSVGRSGGDSLAITSRFDPVESVQLAARFCLFGLLNQLNHFPQLCGVSRINSTIQEHHNVVSSRDGRAYTDLCSDLFAEPNVHLFVVNGAMLVSLIEMPALNTVVRPDCAAGETLLSSRGTVRCIVRDLSGKFVWDSAYLHGPPSIGQCCYVDATQRAADRQADLRLVLRHTDSLARSTATRREDAFDTLSITSSSTLDADGSFSLAPGTNANVSMSQSMLDDRTNANTLTQQNAASRSTSSLGVVNVPVFDGTIESCVSVGAGGTQRLVDPLDCVLEYVANASPECCLQPGEPLNQCALAVDEAAQNLENVVVRQVGELRAKQDEFLRAHIQDGSMCGPLQLPPARATGPLESGSLPSQLCRKMLAHLGYVAWEKRWHIDALEANEQLVRELRHLDGRPSRDTHKIAVVYVARDQEDRRSILANSAGSADFEQFVAALGWEVDLDTHAGFRGGLQSNRSTGTSAPYFATSTLEVLFHVSTRLGNAPSTSSSTSTSTAYDVVTKLRHLGNDLVMIVFSEHTREFRRSLIPTEFADALIVIEPLSNGLYRIRIDCRSVSGVTPRSIAVSDSGYGAMSSAAAAPALVGPLFDGAVLDGRLLAPLVRATAINLSVALRNAQAGFHSFYEERAEYLNSIVNLRRARSTFEEFIERVCTVSQSVGNPAGRVTVDFNVAL